MKYPVLYAQSLAKTMYKHCQKGYAFYATLPYNDTFIKEHELNSAYLEEVYEQLYQVVHDKFLAAVPLYVTNNQKKFIMFKNNVEPNDIKEFVRMGLDELAFHTKQEFKIDVIATNAMIMEIDKTPTIFSANKVGDKLSDSAQFNEYITTLESHGWKNDNGFFPDYNEYLKSKGSENTQFEEIDDDELLADL